MRFLLLLIFCSTSWAQNSVYITQATGTNNSVTVSQSGHNNFDLSLVGNNNLIYVTQSNTTSVNNVNLTVNGNNDSITLSQLTGGKTANVTINGNYNTISETQKGTGSHISTITLVGNDNNIDILQQGSSKQTLTLNLTNAGGPNIISTSQNGNEGSHTYSLTQTCSNPVGCRATVRQGY